MISSEDKGPTLGQKNVDDRIIQWLIVSTSDISCSLYLTSHNFGLILVFFLLQINQSPKLKWKTGNTFIKWGNGVCRSLKTVPSKTNSFSCHVPCKKSFVTKTWWISLGLTLSVELTEKLDTAALHKHHPTPLLFFFLNTFRHEETHDDQLLSSSITVTT